MEVEIAAAGPSLVKADKFLVEQSVEMPYSPMPGTITYPSSCGHGVESIPGITLDMIARRCPLLAEAFEPTRAGPRLHLDNLHHTTARPFVRFLHTGSYSIHEADADIYADVPSSLLLHLRMYHLGAIYELTKLTEQANVNVIRQCEFACSSPDKPIHLVKGIRYAYKHLRNELGLLNTVVSYCVSRFAILESDAEFQELAYDLLPFSQDLCRETMNRGFEDEAAPAIIRMPFQNNVPAEYASRLDKSIDRASDVVFHFHGLDETPTYPKKRVHFERMSAATEFRGVDPGFRKVQPKEPRKSNLVIRNPDRDAVESSERPGGSSCFKRASLSQQEQNKPLMRCEDEDTEDIDMNGHERRQPPSLAVKSSALATSVKAEEYGYSSGLTSWSAGTRTQIPEVKAADAYTDASSGPLFRSSDGDEMDAISETELVKQFKLNFEGQDFEKHDDGFPYFRDTAQDAPKTKAASQPLSEFTPQDCSDVKQPSMSLKWATRNNAVIDLVDLASKSGDRGPVYKSVDDDSPVMPMRDRSARCPLTGRKKSKEKRTQKMSGEDGDYEVVAGPASLLALESSSNSDSDSFELVERPKKRALTVRNPDIDAANMAANALADASKGSPDSDWSLL